MLKISRNIKTLLLSILHATFDLWQSKF